MRSKRKAESKRPEGHRTRRDGARAFLAAAVSTLLAVTVAFSVCAVLASAYIERHPESFTLDPSRLRTARTGAPPTLYYWENGKERTPDTATPLERNADPVPHTVPLTEIPEDLANAFVAIEDKRFYSHVGVDLYRTAAAALRYLSGDRTGFGGSTITQQLVKNVTGESARTPMRKLSEILRALDLEKKLGKAEILECYLNVVPLANGCVGVGEGASRYFGKHPRELTLAECASLAAVTQNPSRYDPEKHPEENRTRRDLILSEMLAQGYITEAAYKEATAAPAVTVEREETAGGVQSWYEDLVAADVIGDLRRTYGYSAAEASRLYYRGGLSVYTLIDPSLQESLERYYEDPSHFPRLENGKAPASAMIVLDSETGDVLAVAGAIGEKRGDRLFSFATDAKRPPGSVLKPLTVYAPALDAGRITYASVYDDVPVTFRKSGDDLIPWPRNASGVYRGLSSVDLALRQSLNTVAVRILSEIGIDRAFDYAKNTLGIASLRDGTEGGASDKGEAALALGQMSYGATLREITAAYTAFSDRGVYRSARSYALVTDRDGTVLLDNAPKAQRALSEENAAVMTKMLENVTKSGTARALTLTDKVAVAGKTGTTQYSFDRWFVGYTTELLAGVWYGCEYPDSLDSIKGNPALSIFDEVMTELSETRPGKKHFDLSSLRTVRVCADSGLLVTDICTKDPRGDRSTLAYFTEDTVPTRFCTCHTPVTYVGTGENDGDGVLTDGGEAIGGRTVGLVRVDRRFPVDLFVTDAQYTACDPRNTPPPHGDASRPYYATLLPKDTYPGRSYTARPYNRPHRRESRGFPDR